MSRRKLKVDKDGDSLSIEHKYLRKTLGLLISSILNNNNNNLMYAHDFIYSLPIYVNLSVPIGLLLHMNNDQESLKFLKYTPLSDVLFIRRLESRFSGRFIPVGLPVKHSKAGLPSSSLATCPAHLNLPIGLSSEWNNYEVSQCEAFSIILIPLGSKHSSQLGEI